MEIEAILFKTNTTHSNGRIYTEECLKKSVEDFNKKLKDGELKDYDIFVGFGNGEVVKKMI